MLLFSALVASAAVAAPVAAPAQAMQPADTSISVQVVVDSAKKVVRVIAGPFRLENMPPMDDHAMMDHGATHDTPVHRFAWPVDGWLRGFEWRLRDAAGNELPKHVMHHMIMVNLSRRQLLYSAAERLLGAGSETEDVTVPKTIGVPMEPGYDLGFYVAWHNDTGRDMEGVYLELDMLWTPSNQNPRPKNSLPIYMDVNLTVGGSNTYDVPPGRSEKSFEFTMPIGGRLLGVGGHMHDYGEHVRLEDAGSGKELARVKAKVDANGKIEGVTRQLFGITGEGLKLEKGRRYRVVGVYDNPTGHTLINGAMSHMAGLFVPDDLAEWPKIDPNDPTFQRDLASLQVRGTGAADGHGAHDHGDGAQGGTSHDAHDAHDAHSKSEQPAAAPAASGHSHGAAHSHGAHEHGGAKTEGTKPKAAPR